MTFSDKINMYIWHYIKPNLKVSLPVYKHQEIINTGKSHNIDTLIETGTFIGDTVMACAPHFKSIFTIELSNDLFISAQEKFSSLKHVRVLHGDSGHILPELLDKLNSRALFWLDAHYSLGVTAKSKQNTPIIDELKQILSHHVKDHVILIDDARCFHPKYVEQFEAKGQYEAAESLRGYPSVIELANLITSYGSYRLKIENDIIRITKN
jgi:hypothetical protein